MRLAVKTKEQLSLAELTAFDVDADLPDDYPIWCVELKDEVEALETFTEMTVEEMLIQKADFLTLEQVKEMLASEEV